MLGCYRIEGSSRPEVSKHLLHEPSHGEEGYLTIVIVYTYQGALDITGRRVLEVTKWSPCETDGKIIATICFLT